MFNTPLLSTHYENTPIQIYLEFYHQKNENFQMKNSGSFHISAQNIDCGYFLELLDEAVLTSTHTLWFWAEIRKLMSTPVNPSGVSGGQNYIGMFSWWISRKQLFSMIKITM